MERGREAVCAQVTGLSPNFTAYTRWTVSNDWSPHASPRGRFADSTLTRWCPRLLSSLQQQQSDCMQPSVGFLSACWLVTLCSALPLVLSLQERTRNYLGFFQFVQSLFSNKACVGLTCSPTWQLASLQFWAKLQGIRQQRESPETGWESPAVPANLRSICEIKWRKSIWKRNRFQVCNA